MMQLEDVIYEAGKQHFVQKYNCTKSGMHIRTSFLTLLQLGGMEESHIGINRYKSIFDPLIFRAVFYIRALFIF